MGRWVKFAGWLLCVACAFYLGMEIAGEGRLMKLAAKVFQPERAERLFAVTEHKPFVVVVPSYNNSLWVERNLRSIFEQKYDNYRVIYVNDGSTDSTGAQAQELAEAWSEGHRFTLIDNEENRGAMENIYRAVHLCSADEIVLILDGDDWFAHDRVFERLNEIYADPDVWVTWGSYVEYPNYATYHVANFARPLPQSVIDGGKIRQYSKKHWCFSQLRTFYAGLFHQIKLKDLCYEGKFVDATYDVTFFVPVMEMAGAHVRYVKDILYIWNRATALNDDKVRGKRQLQIAKAIYERTPYLPLKAWSGQEEALAQKADLIVFSYDRPLQLYALLESVELYCKNIDQVTVIYRTSGKEYEAAYEEVGRDFAGVKMVRQTLKPHKDFQKNVLQALQEGPSRYFMFAVDDIIVTDEIDVGKGVAALERTGAYGFFYRLGKEIDYDYMLDIPIEVPQLMRIDEDLYGWMFKRYQGYWGYPTSTDLVLYQKERVLKEFEKISFKHPNQMETEWLKVASPSRIGLCHATSRMVNIPVNLVNKSGNRCLEKFSPKELLEVFNQHLKIDLSPLHRCEHHSAHIDYDLSFTERDDEKSV